MGMLNSKKSGFYAFIQPLIPPGGGITVGNALGPQELILANSQVTLENAGIDTTHTIHPVTFNTPTYPGAVIGTTNGIGKAISGYSKCLMVNGYPAVTNSTKKMLNTGNCPIAPMVQSTQAKSYVYVADSGGGGGFRGGSTLTPEQLAQIKADNPPWSKEKLAAFNARFKRCTDTPPTPAPQSILGKCQYYQWRNDDFIKRHQGCDHLNPPAYYLQYGLIFCRLFSTELSEKMDVYGKGWIDRTRLNLQVNMETFLKTNPTIELNNHSFYEASFQSHQKAYLDAGFLNLSGQDVVQFLDVYAFVETIVPIDYVNKIAYKQAVTLAKMYISAHDNDSIGGLIYELSKETVYLSQAWGGSFLESIRKLI